MFKISKTKTKKVIRIVESLGLLLWVLLILFNYTSQSTEAAPSIELSAYVVNAKDQGVLDGDYDVRFALYTKDRTASDQSEADSKVWEETQKLTIQNGLIRASLGGLKEFPKELDFSQNQYYLGIKIGDNGEMVPRKKIGSNFFSINAISALNANSAASLNGSVIGIAAGNIPVLATGGTLAPTMLPAITKLGAVSTGTWEADMVASNYIAKALSGKTYNGLTVTASGSEFVLETGANNSLTLSNGALSLSSMGSAGSVAYSDGTKFSFTDQGAAGQVLISNGTSVPYWGDLGSNLIVPDSLDFSELKDSLTLDSNLEISPSAHNYSIDIDGNTFFVDTALNRVGIGTTSPASALEVNGTITASSLSISGNATLGTLGVSGENITSNSSFIPSFTGLNLGSSSNHWAALYVDNLSVSGTDLNGTTAEYFHINTDASSEQSMGIRFYKGSVENGYASIIWDSTSHQFVLYSKESASTLGALTAGNITAGTYNGNTITTGTGTLNLGSYALALTGNSNIDQNLLTTSTPAFAGLFTSGNVGIGTTSPSNLLTVNGDVQIGSMSSLSTFQSPQLQINASSAGANNLLVMGNTDATAGNSVSMLFYPRGYGAGTLSDHSLITITGTAGPSTTFSLSNENSGTSYTAMTIDSAGNVVHEGTLTVQGTGNSSIAGNLGIGTTSPAQLLTVGKSGADAIARITSNYSDFGLGAGTTATANAILELNAAKLSSNYKYLGKIVVSADAGANGYSDMAFYTSQLNQYNTTPNLFMNYQGNVGIGTTSPTALLHTVGNVAGEVAEYLSNTNAAGYTVFRFGQNVTSSNIQQTMNFGYFNSSWTPNGDVLPNMGILTTGTSASNGMLFLAQAANSPIVFAAGSYPGTEVMRLTSSGKVGIGTTSPDTTLKVVGSICAKATDASCAGTTAGIIYADNFVASGTQLTVPDYVFEPNYNLMPLSDLEVYVAANKHLPDMPSESDIQKNGLNYSSMLMGLLQKTEENTLYIIQNNDQFQELTANNQQLTANLGDLTLKTDQNVTTLQGLQASVDEELAKVDSEFKDYDSRITDLQNQMGDQQSLIAKLQTQIDELKQMTNQDLNLAQIQANKNDIDLIKLVLGLDRVANPGDVQLLGKLETDGVVAGAFTLKIVENQDPLFGKDKISAGDTKVTIKNKNVSKGSLINITLTSDTQSQAVYVSSQEDGKFEVAVKEKADKDITFNWWIMETNDDSSTTSSSVPTLAAPADTSAPDTTTPASSANSPMPLTTAPAAGSATTSDTGATAPATGGTGAVSTDTGAGM